MLSVMEALDHKNTFALLIGTSIFPNDSTIQDIPNVEVNIKMLQQHLTEISLVGIPPENIRVSLNEDENVIQRKLLEISKLTKSKQTTLLLYYSGHGIMSSVDYELYLATKATTIELLEIEGINIETFKKYVKMSKAGRKIVILDCCHSGHIIGSMGNLSSKLQSEIKGFEGTFVMTSSAEDTPSLFPEGHPEKPTNFTGKLLEVISSGIEDSGAAYNSIGEIFEEIKNDFSLKGLPKPQQSTFNNASDLLFAKNIKYSNPRSAMEIAWEQAMLKNSKLDFLDFVENFPNAPNLKDAMLKIEQLEILEYWEAALQKNTISAFLEFRLKFPDSNFVTDANLRIKALKEKKVAPAKDKKEQPLIIELETEPNENSRVQEVIKEHDQHSATKQPIDKTTNSTEQGIIAEKKSTNHQVSNTNPTSVDLILHTFTGFNCIKFKDRNSYFYLDISIGTADIFVRKNSIEIKNLMMGLKINGIKSIRYLDADKDKSLAYNFVQIDFTSFERKPIFWNEELRIVLFKLSYTGSKPTLKLYNDLLDLVKKGKLQLEK